MSVLLDYTELDVDMVREQVKDKCRRITLVADWREKMPSKASRKEEEERAEIKKKLEIEMIWRTKEQKSKQHMVENISSLEKERTQLADWVKRTMA